MGGLSSRAGAHRGCLGPSPDGSPHLGKVCRRTPSRGLRVPPPRPHRPSPSPQRVLGLKALSRAVTACQYPGALWAGPWVGAARLGGPGWGGAQQQWAVSQSTTSSSIPPPASRWSTEDLLCAGRRCRHGCLHTRPVRLALAFGTQSILEPDEQENSHKARFLAPCNSHPCSHPRVTSSPCSGLGPRLAAPPRQQGPAWPSPHHTGALSMELPPRSWAPSSSPISQPQESGPWSGWDPELQLATSAAQSPPA